MPSLKKNVIFNFIGQFYSVFIGILILPFYLQELGTEAFGLIGFFTLLLAWLQLLDLGMTPTLGREVSRLKSDPDKHHELRTVVRSLEVVFVGVAVITTAAMFLSRNWLTNDWLRIQELDTSLVAKCIGLMAFMVGVRWLSSLYKSGILAYEQQVWANTFDIVIVTLRFPVALAIIMLSQGNIFFYFIFQLILAVAECLIYSWKLKQIMPSTDKDVRFNKKSLIRIAPFALAIGYTAGIWVFVTQLDKLLLSKLLSLTEFGYFSLIATLSGGIMFLSSPVGRAVLPRMTSLLAQDKEEEMLAIYINATKIVSIIVAPVVLAISIYPKAVIYIWTGNLEASEWTAEILPLYVLGYGLLTIGAFQYYLQYAHGKLRQHIIYATVSALVSLPLVIFSAYTYGPIGVAWVWFIFRLISLLFWAPYIHHLFAPGIHGRWFVGAILPPILVCVFVAFISHLAMDYEFLKDRVSDFFVIALMTTLMFSFSIVVTFPREIRIFVNEKF